jgi:hypothetical protein
MLLRLAQARFAARALSLSLSLPPAALITLHFRNGHGSLDGPLLSLSPESHCLVKRFCQDEILQH